MDKGTVRKIDPTRPPGAFRKAIMKVANTQAGRSFGINLSARVDPTLLRLTRGRFATTSFFPLVTLITVGRKSGKERESTLLYFTRGGDVILIASSFGRDRNPAWYYNATANPDVELMVKGSRLPYRAVETEGQEREELFALAERLYPGYRDYRLRTEGKRQIPVLRLSPRD